MRVAELQMYRETAFERDGRDSNENAPRVYLQRPPSQAEADVADPYTTIIMSLHRRSCTEQTKSYGGELLREIDLGQPMMDAFVVKKRKRPRWSSRRSRSL